MKKYVAPALKVESFVPSQTIAASNGPEIGSVITYTSGNVTVTVVFMGYMNSWAWWTFYDTPEQALASKPGGDVYAADKYGRSDWGNEDYAFDGYNGAPLDGVLDHDNSSNLPGGRADLLVISQAFAAAYNS